MTRAVVGLAALVAMAGCGRRASGQEQEETRPEPAAAQPKPAEPAAVDAPPTVSLADCKRLPFASPLPIAEASGAVWLPQDGGVIVVIADSGHRGDYLIIDDDDGKVLETGKLPLDGRGDDLEGLATDGDRLWAITSSGWMRSWKRKDGGGYHADLHAYRIDDDDECSLDAVNCGHNYEGLCFGAAT